MKWCEHINSEVNYFVERPGECELLRVLPKFCYECGTPRPEPKKSLAEKLRDGTVWTFKESNHTSTPLWETTAKAALNHFSEIVDEYLGRLNNDGVELKKRFKDSL